MREIKFRAWDAYNKEMINNYCELIENRFNGEDLTNTHYQTPIAVMQYTGFKDSNAKQIYEGDIIEYVSIKRDEHRVRAVVEFDQECGGWYVGAKMLSDIIHEQHNKEWQKTQGYTQNEKHIIKIIGNIYENPKLLNK